MTKLSSFEKRIETKPGYSMILAALAFLFTVLAAQPAAYGAGCTPISSLPYSITAPGKYCLSGDLSISDSTSAAITISASNVLLDLDGYTLSGGDTSRP